MRFPQFNDQWKFATISEVCKTSTGSMNTQDKIEGGAYPFYVRSSTIERANKYTYDGIAILTPGDGAIGKVFHYSEGKIAVHQRVYILSDITIGTKYLFYYFADKFYNRVIRMSAKNTVDSVRMNMITDMPISLPSLAEQEKIAGFLSLIDERIESCSETIKERKAQKSCLRTLILNRMTVRWIKLKQAVEQGIINLKRGEVIPKQSQSSENIYPVYSSSVQNKGLMGFHNSYMFDKELISWSIDGGGHLFYRPRHKFNVTNVCGVLETSCFDYVFLCEVLKEQHRKLLFDYQNKAHPSVIQELYQVPMLEISEQRYYGKLFRLLDERIEVEEELLEQYERQKRYLLKQMFI
ncbi:hypothetical protein EW639_05205 [Porphyromonas gingivalis]|uniref:restriction endonuclease subunit S n=1 Tax=Porphyromonas gingivalis TaxID=837 RepID=UPI00102A50F1|nr:restriction endonuclease subunit S [Porphyromonas gingivalis]RZQ67545.1 hypothetical protein EW639_05205 [Porphyromonas gingivalis]